MKKIPIKRFIAGAVCPKCAEMDKIVIYETEEGSFRECVSCGFLEKQNFQFRQAELETRVNKTEEQIKSETQVLNFSPAPSDSSKK